MVQTKDGTNRTGVLFEEDRDSIRAAEMAILLDCGINDESKRRYRPSGPCRKNPNEAASGDLKARKSVS